MCCNHKSVDLSLIADVLDKYAAVKGSLITILQKTQDVYGYIPTDAIYHIAEKTGLTPKAYMEALDRVTLPDVVAAANTLEYHTGYFLKGATA